jgi:hypothetical protein
MSARADGIAARRIRGVAGADVEDRGHRAHVEEIDLKRSVCDAAMSLECVGQRAGPPDATLLQRQ